MIPGFVISWATFPGVIVHEAAHFLFCRIFGLAVFEVKFFQLGNPAGYVVHEETKDFTTAFFVGIAPFIVSTVLCLVFCLPAFVPVWELEIADPVAYFFYWLGLSIGMNAFPSSQDLSNVWALAAPAARAGNTLAILSYPLTGLLFLANLGRMFWLDFGYGILIGVLVPLAIFSWLV
jgi:hypothetical protein